MSITRWIFLIMMISFSIYATIIRFNNPKITETELFLKLLGL